MFATLITRIKQELAYQRDLAEMEAMDDRQLADIGVTRYELATALRKGHSGAQASGMADGQTSYFNHRAA